MNLHQFRFVQEAVRQNLNLTETAKALFTSQPGISKAILELEGELGVDIFARHGKRLRRVTEPGQQVLRSIEIIMREVNNLKRIGDEFSKQDAGTLSIATTHTQARYFLPEPVAQLRRRFPKVSISLHQGAPAQVAQMVASPPRRSTRPATSSPCPATSGSMRWSCRQAIRWRRSSASRWRTWPCSPWCRTTRRTAGARGSTARSRLAGSSRTSCSRRSTPT
jgi:DNA-binding transcriptional LysR family regulator